MLRVLGENGFTHDSSFALGGHSNPPMYPYTLDYPSELVCAPAKVPLGAKPQDMHCSWHARGSLALLLLFSKQCFIEVCPANTAVKGLWEIPLLFWENVNKTQDYGCVAAQSQRLMTLNCKGAEAFVLSFSTPPFSSCIAWPTSTSRRTTMTCSSFFGTTLHATTPSTAHLSTFSSPPAGSTATPLRLMYGKKNYSWDD